MRGTIRLSTRGWLGLAIGVGAALRAGWAAYAARPLGLVAGDPFLYQVYARDLADGRGYLSVVTGEPTAFQPPGWPLLLGAWYWIADHTPIPGSDVDLAAALGVALGVGTLVLLAAVTRHLFDSRVAALATGLYAVWPNVVFGAAVPALETCFVAGVLLLLWLLLRAGWPSRPPAWPTSVAIGAVVGAVVLVRPFAASVLVAAAVSGLVAGHGPARTARAVLPMVLAAVAVVTPWTVRNAVVLDGFVPLSTNVGETFCLGHHPGATGGYALDDPYCVGGHTDVRDGHDEVRRNDHAMSQGLRYALRHPFDEVVLTGWRAFYTVRSDHDALAAAESNGATPFLPPRAREVLEWLADTWWVSMALLGALGAGSILRRDRPDRLLVGVTAIGLLLVPLGLYGLPRFKVPLAPFLAIGAAVSLLRLVDTARAGRDDRGARRLAAQ
jgi:hypothetical protein